MKLQFLIASKSLQAKKEENHTGGCKKEWHWKLVDATIQEKKLIDDHVSKIISLLNSSEMTVPNNREQTLVPII